jgi:hypothetical protein
MTPRTPEAWHITLATRAFNPQRATRRWVKEDCENFLHEFRGFLVDLIRVFNHLYGTHYSEASEWTSKTRSHPKSVVDYAVETLGKDNLKTRFLAQMKTSHEPFVWMRHAVTHPGERSGILTIPLMRRGTLSNRCGGARKAAHGNTDRS